MGKETIKEGRLGLHTAVWLQISQSVRAWAAA